VRPTKPAIRQLLGAHIVSYRITSISSIVPKFSDVSAQKL